MSSLYSAHVGGRGQAKELREKARSRDRLCPTAGFLLSRIISNTAVKPAQNGCHHLARMKRRTALVLGTVRMGMANFVASHNHGPHEALWKDLYIFESAVCL